MIDPISIFNKTLLIQASDMTIHNTNTDVKHTIKLAPSNYSRNLSGPEEITIEGKEFVVSKKALDAAGYGTLQIGHKIIGADIGVNTISEIKNAIVILEIK